MHRSGAAQRVGRHFRQADRADLALLDQVGHRPHRLLDRHGEIAAVHIIEIDVIGAQQPQRDLKLFADGLGLAIDAALVAAGEYAHLAGQKHFFAPTLQRFAHQRLVVAQAIEPGGIEMVIAQLDRAVQQGNRIGIGRTRTIGPAQRHAAKPDRVGQAAIDRTLVDRADGNRIGGWYGHGGAVSSGCLRRCQPAPPGVKDQAPPVRSRRARAPLLPARSARS